MTPQQIELVKESFAKVAPIADAAATIFYDRVFEIDPPLRHLFSADLREQRAKLMAMLTVAVNNLHRWETILPQLRDLGRRHVGYNVKPKDYDTVGAALIGTLRNGLGESFTPEVEDAWMACYATIAGAMKTAAESFSGEP
jgi:hemoglobin-like flavoprotein